MPTGSVTAVTDVPFVFPSLPARLGVRFRTDEHGLVGVLDPDDAPLERGMFTMAGLMFLADAVAGVTIDTDPDSWAFTSDLSVRVPGRPATGVVLGRCTVLRDGRRSTVCEITFSDDLGPIGNGYASFARVARRETDPPKPPPDISGLIQRLTIPAIDEPFRVAAGFESREPGTVASSLRSDLLNPAGAMQGAIVAGLAEAAALDLADSLYAMGTERHVVCEMDVRYLAQNRVAPILARASMIGDPALGAMRIELFDGDGSGRLTTSVTARVAPAP